MRFTDVPIFQNIGSGFEFARMNRWRLVVQPKQNMQLLQYSGSALVGQSPTGTLVLAVDQIPIYTSANSGSDFTVAPTWSNDSSNDTGVTSSSFVSCGMTTSYIRGIPGAREKELYKKQSISFYPAFYDYIMSGFGTGAISAVTNPLGGYTGSTFSNNGCVERKIKKWITINNLTASTAAQNVGPLYFGPVYALDVNEPPPVGAPSLFDMRLYYSVSFKRPKGS